MPGPSIQEQDVSNYWAQNYNPVTDVAATGHYYLESGRYGTMTQMTDGSMWFDHDDDGWFDVGRRFNENGSIDEFDGQWRNLTDGEMETAPSGAALLPEEPMSPVLEMWSSSSDTGWFLLE